MTCLSSARTLQGMARVRSGQAPAWPLVSDRSVRRGSGVKRDFACTFTRRFSPVLVVRRSQSRLMLEGRARTLSGPSPDLSQATTVVPSGRSEDLLIRSHPCGHPDPFRSVRDLGRVPTRCSCPFGIPEGRSPRWLPAWLPAARPAVTTNGFQEHPWFMVRHHCYLRCCRPGWLAKQDHPAYIPRSSEPASWPALLTARPIAVPCSSPILLDRCHPSGRGRRVEVREATA